MRLFGFLRRSADDLASAIRTEHLTLRVPESRDYEAWAALRAASRAFLAPWEPAWPADDLTPAAFRNRLARIERERRSGEAYSFFVLDADGATLCGGLTLGNIRRRAAQSATLGYWMGEAFAGRGMMTQAVQAVIPFAFGPLALERLEAACLPENHASVRVLEKCGFREEGLARSYLAIAGERRDHRLFGLVPADCPALPARKG